MSMHVYDRIALREDEALSDEEVAILIRAIEGGALDEANRAWIGDSDDGLDGCRIATTTFSSLLGRPVEYPMRDRGAYGWQVYPWNRLAKALIDRRYVM